MSESLQMQTCAVSLVVAWVGLKREGEGERKREWHRETQKWKGETSGDWGEGAVLDV